MRPDPPARVPRLRVDEETDATRAMFDVFSGMSRKVAEENYVFRTFAHHPDLATPFLRFNLHLLATTTLPVRLRQIAILRVAWTCAATYMWSSHLRTTLAAGLEDGVFEPVKAGADDPYWTADEATILRATDRLLVTSDLDDASWEALTAVLDRPQSLDFLFTVGAYAMLAMVFNALRIEREPELLALAAKYGAPERAA